MLSIISNIDCNFFILFFFELPSKSIISLLFGELSNVDYFFAFLGIDRIDSQPCSYGMSFVKYILHAVAQPEFS